MSQQRRHVRERRMERRAHEHERGTGGDRVDRNMKQNKCWVRMERDVTEGEKWQQWSQLHHWSDSCTHPDSSASLSSSASPAEDGSSSTYGCLHAASSVYYRYRGVCIFLYITALCPQFPLSSGRCSRSGLIKITFSKKTTTAAKDTARNDGKADRKYALNLLND